jgi:DNA mismatch repair protein MutS2
MLISINRNKATVRKKNISLQCYASDLYLEQKQSKNSENAKINSSFNFNQLHSTDAKLTYDCRGMRLDEFKTLFEIAVNDLMMEKIPILTIIHGHGSGILKSWLRSEIIKNDHIERLSDESGNDGQTILTLVK